MGRTRTFDMEDAIGTATTLFWRGYDKTSLTDLTGALGIGAASFYFAFESKEALFREVVAATSQVWKERTRMPSEHPRLSSASNCCSATTPTW